jgi:hypothetical protein
MKTLVTNPIAVLIEWYLMTAVVRSALSMRPVLKPAAALVALGLALGYLVSTQAQQATINVTVPTLPNNTAQWGGSTVTAATTLSDTAGNPTAPSVGADDMLWDTSQWLRHKSAALATFPTSQTLTSRNIVGAAVTERSSRWSVIHNPAASSQATASIAAEGGVRHVADCIAFSAGSTTAPTLTALTVNLRDGATGAGTIIWTHEVVVSNATGQNVAPFSTCGLNLVGTTNTAMTAEFSSSLTNLIEAVSLSGINLQ